ncbi:MAG: hypothetical protein U9Q37_08420, partial [Euryarchaeota archaeon]|nr:hypothetical protein [Euryarchaeota archaeon]
MRLMQMTEGSNSSNHFRTRVRVQRTPTGRLLGAAVMIPAEIIGGFVKDDTEMLDIEFGVLPEGILLKIGGGTS